MKNTKNKFSNIISIALVAAIVFSIPMAANAAGVQADTKEKNDEYKYTEYIKKNTNVDLPETEISINASEGYSVSDGAEVSVGDYASRSNALIWKNGNGDISWDFNAEKAGNYHLKITYFSIDKNAKDVQFGIKLDGSIPFFEANQITMPKCFKSDGKITQDEIGNDIRPKQVPYDEWITSSVNDLTGISNTPYSFYLTAGKHTLTLSGITANIAIEKLEFYNDKELPSYSEYVSGKTTVNTDYTKIYEAEEPLYQSSSMLYPTYDRTSADTSPSDPSKIRYNTIGQKNYNSQGQYIVWTVDVPKDGYYYLGARIRKNINSGTVSYRRLYINGEVPFKEADSVKFEFSNRWQQYVFGGEKPWLFKLKSGENHIKLEVVIGEMTEIIVSLQELVSELNTLYREIIMITGTTPDNYRDYHINKEIEDFDNRVKAMSALSEKILDRAVDFGNSGSGDFSAITKLKLLLDKFISSPDEITNNISTLSSYSSGISSLILTLKSQPLELDTIAVSSSEKKLSKKSMGFFGNILFQLKAFIGSFTEDYNSIGQLSDSASSSIDVWISSGRDQATILTDLTDSLFTPKSKIDVKISLVQQSLIQASLSGMTPEVVLYVANNSPVELAIRDGLVPMSQFDTFKEVTSRFHPTSMDAYYFNGDYYGIPLTETFPLMFYRTDILKEMNLEPPETWDDLYKIIRVLQQNNLSVGIPNTTSGNVMSVDTSIYYTFMYQLGEKLYSEDLKTTNLNSNVGIDTFGRWTELYKDYGIPYQYDFFNRFRSGDMPLGLAGYSFYGQLKQTAPEIDGLWEMAPIPGTLDKNGKINRAVAVGGSCAVILKGSDNYKDAWKFIDWFSDTEAQSLFGQQIESLLGQSGRYTPACTEALSNLPWTKKDLKIITEQWNQGFKVPRTPGDYIVDRNIVNAFRRVVFSSGNPRETIVSYNKTIEKEMQRKRKEYNLD